MKKTLTFLFSIITISVFAQPQINDGNMPVLNDHVVIAICSNDLNPGDPGEMQTWDMSGLTESEEQYFDYMLPTECPKVDSFPNSNICGVSWENDYSFYNLSGNSLTVEGYVVTYGVNDTAVMVFDDPETILELPYTYNDEFIDDFAGTSHIFDVGTFPFDGSLDFEADGYGTLILPTGTYENVVRYHFFREQTNYVGGFPSTTQTKEQWAWVSPEYRFWLLLMEENFDGFATTTLIWYDKNPYSASTGIANLENSGNYVYPNPAKQGQNLKLIWDRSEKAVVSIVALNGNRVAKIPVYLMKGPNSIDLANTIAGMYILKIESGQRCFTQKLSVLE